MFVRTIIGVLGLPVSRRSRKRRRVVGRGGRPPGVISTPFPCIRIPLPSRPLSVMLSAISEPPKGLRHVWDRRVGNGRGLR